jgi:uncharacterized protein YlaI
MSDRCTNCLECDADSYELQLRNDSPTEVYLCDECRAALEAEFVWDNDEKKIS